MVAVEVSNITAFVSLEYMPASGVLYTACRRSFLALAHTSRRCTRHSSSSSKRWQARQGKDRYVTEAKVQNLKSRAAFKLLEVLGSRPNPLIAMG